MGLVLLIILGLIFYGGYLSTQRFVGEKRGLRCIILIVVISLLGGLFIIPMPLAVILIIGILYVRIRRDNREVEEQSVTQEQRGKKLFDELKKAVTHYCPNCGMLISNQIRSYNFCTICGTKLKDATREVVLESVFFSNEKIDTREKEIAKERYSEALRYYNMGKYQQFLTENSHAVEAGYSPAIYVLGYAHYHSKGVAKNNIYAQKYMEEAALIGYSLAYRYSTERCIKGDFRWSKTIKNLEEGYFKAAIRGDLKAIDYVLFNLGGVRQETTISEINSPAKENQRLWWAIRAAEKGNLNGIKIIYEICEKAILTLSEFKDDKKAIKMITQYNSIKSYWKEKELRMKYPDEDCYNAYLAESKGEYEKALSLYERASKRNVQPAIEAYRRLSGNFDYMKVVKTVSPKRTISLEQALSEVTHYCPKCGFLLSDAKNQTNKCPMCESDLLYGNIDEEFVTLELFAKPHGSEITRDEIRYYNFYPELSEAEKKRDYRYIANYAKEHPNDGVAQYVLACTYDKKGDAKIYFEQLELAYELNSSEAAYCLGKLYYEGIRGAEKDNVLAQKYMETAALWGCGKAYNFIVQRCISGEFRWSHVVRNEEDGLFKAAIRGVGVAGFKVCQTYGGNRKIENLADFHNRVPFETVSKLWWMIRMARQGELEAVAYIEEYCTSMMKICSQYKENEQACKLYKKYEEILNYWKEKKIVLEYPNPLCCQGVLAEKNGEFVAAREYYKLAAEKDNDEQAIVAFRRLTGNKKFMLKNIPQEGFDYMSHYEKAQSFLEMGEYQTCRMWARTALEMYTKNLFFLKQEDMPIDAELLVLINTVKERQMVDEITYNGMDFIRRKGNKAIHGEIQEDEELAYRVMDALTQIIEN